MLLKGAGGWEGAPGGSSSWYKGRLDGKNIADVLKGWGFAPTVTSEDFHLDVDGRWPGSPGLGRAQAFLRQPGCNIPQRPVR